MKKSIIFLYIIIHFPLFCHAQEIVTKPFRQFGLGTLDAIASSPDGQHILTAGGGAYLWDISTGEVIRTFTGHKGIIECVVFSPDGTKFLTGSRDNTAKLWDTTTGKVLQTFSGHIKPVMSVAFSPDGTQILTGSTGRNHARGFFPG